MNQNLKHADAWATIDRIDYRNPAAEFDRAIASGRLSADPAATNYAGDFMYMGTNRDSGRAYFKHSVERTYLD